MKIQLIFALLMVTCIACTPSATQDEYLLIDSTQTTPVVAITDTNVELVTYESATVYTGTTIYGFKAANGELRTVSGTMYTEEGGEEFIELPDNMIESSDTLDGLPGINPNYVGKKFNLFYGQDSLVYKIEMVK